MLGSGWLQTRATLLQSIAKEEKVTTFFAAQFFFKYITKLLNANEYSTWCREVFPAVTGRTGTMVCTWLIDSDQFESAQVLYISVKKYVQCLKSGPFHFYLGFMFDRTA